MTGEGKFEGRNCPVYALQPVRIFGLSKQSVVALLSAWGFCKYFLDPFLAVFVGFFVGFVVEKVSSKREPNYLMHLMSSRATGSLAESVGKSWRAQGAMPSPNYQRHYEP